MQLQGTDSNVFETILARRSVRSYRDGTLDRKTVNSLLEAAVRAPTSEHSEPWAFVIVQDRTLLERLSDRAKPLIAEELRRAGPADRPAEKIPDPESSLFYDAGTLILICARPLGPFATADCWLAAENLMLAASALGLGSCVIGAALPALNIPEVKAELGIRDDYLAVAPIIVGHPRGESAMSSRREPSILAWLPGADAVQAPPAASPAEARAPWQPHAHPVPEAAIKTPRRP